MAKQPKSPTSERPADDFSQVGAIDPMLIRIKVSAPAGNRRRADISFGPTPIIITMADLGETMEAAQDRLKVLMSDPQLSVAPVLDEAPPAED